MSDDTVDLQVEAPMPHMVLDKTKFLNVDLVIYSKSNLQPLVDAMGDKIIALYVGRERRMYKTVLELTFQRHNSPESVIRRFCELIRKLPAEARESWDAARSREFSVGIEAPEPMHYYWFSLAPTVINAASEINAFISATIYGPMKKAVKHRKAASSA